MKDDNLGCMTMRCQKIGGKLSPRKGYWCCYGCDEEECPYRCRNNRAVCHVATTSSRLETTTGDDWTNTEIGILQSNYYAMRVEEIQKLLPRKTVGAIYNKAYKMGMKKNMRRKKDGAN